MEALTKNLFKNSLQDVSILLTEDDSINQLVAKTLLTKWGFHVTIANNGKEAVDLIQSRKFQVVLMDLHMPIMDGVEATRQIRAMQDPYFKTIPIIALSATAGNTEMAVEIGMNDFAMKPIDPQFLYNKIVEHHLKNLAAEPVHHKINLDLDLYTDGDEALKQELITHMIANLEELYQAVREIDGEGAAEKLNGILHKIKPTIIMLEDNQLIEALAHLKMSDVTNHRRGDVASRVLNAIENVISALHEEIMAAVPVLVTVGAKAA
jgi:CheY-like chemotaxis protein